MQVAERELQLLDVPKPRVLARGGDSGVEVRLNHSELVGLRWVDLQEAATHASVFVSAARTVRAYAVTEFDFPPAEVLTEFLEFFGRGLAVLLDRPFGAAPGHKLLVMFDDLGGVSGLWRRQILQLSECLSLAVCSAADFGGVVGPVACGGALPGHGDGDVDAEHAGEDGGGQVGGELEQRGGAVSGGLESELAESLGECVRADWAPGLPAGE